MRRWANSWDTAPPKFPCWSDGPTVGALGSSPHIVKPSQVTALSVPWPLVVSVLGVVRAVLDDQYVLSSAYFAVRGVLWLPQILFSHGVILPFIPLYTLTQRL